MLKHKHVSNIGVALCCLVLTAFAQAETPQSPRQEQAEPMFWLHTRGELRSGFIQLQPKQGQALRAMGAGGHIHLSTAYWHGLRLATTLYAVEDIEPGETPTERLNPDFFDAQGNGFVIAGEAYVAAQWKQSEFKLGRQAIETPHVDGDDLRMLPNLYRAWTLHTTLSPQTTLSTGLADRMAGWENSVDARRFVTLSDAMGLAHRTQGVVWLGVHHRTSPWGTTLWAYRYDDVAQVLYGELSYTFTENPDRTWLIAVQADHARDLGAQLSDPIGSDSLGAYLELDLQKPQLEISLAYNTNHGTGGAFTSLGGGPFFTSLEDQTLDAIGAPGEAWIVSLTRPWNFPNQSSLNLGVTTGQFRAFQADSYKTEELDLYAEYHWHNALQITAALANIKDRDNPQANSEQQIRLIVSYAFQQ